MTYKFDNDVAIITGGAMGIGLACAQRLSSLGTKIILWDKNKDALKKSEGTFNNKPNCIDVDITNFEDVNMAYEKSINLFQNISILINSAGINGLNETVENYSISEWLKVINLNLNSTFFVNKVVIPIMKKNNYGRIVNISSIAGKEGNPNASAYSASKAGVIGFTKSLGKELSKYNISVNCITPSVAKTPILEQATNEHIKYMLSKVPRGRFLETYEISSMVTWLVSNENSFTTGAVFDISGGRATY